MNKISGILNKCGGKSSHIADRQEFFHIINDALIFRRNVLIARHFEDIDKEMIRAFHTRAKRSGMEQEYMTIDAWSHCSAIDNDNNTWDNIRGNLSLSLQLAYGLKRQGVWKTHTKLRALVAVRVKRSDRESQETKDKISETYARLQKLLKIIRVNANIVVFTIETPVGGEEGGFEKAFNFIVRAEPNHSIGVCTTTINQSEDF